MNLSLFDLVGPIMLGPSSSHTAGAARIGYMARLIAGKEPEHVTLYFHPVLMQTYTGHRTHAAIMAGLLGCREDDPAGVQALETAKTKGIPLTVREIGLPDVHQNTMRIEMGLGGRTITVNGISVGGGSILITEIDGIQVNLDGNTYGLLIRSNKPIGESIRDELALSGLIEHFTGKTGQEYFTCLTLRIEVPEKALASIRALPWVTSVQLVPPLYLFREITPEKNLFSDFTSLIELAEKSSLPEAALAYECHRSGKSKEIIINAFKQIWTVMRESMEEGLQGQAKLLGGFCPGNDGRRLMQAYQEGRTITGGILAPAIARAISTLEINGASGCIVAAPTAGSAGVLPAVVYTTGEQLGKNEDDQVKALLTAAAVGVCIANKASLSGAVGGCQGEVGVAAAMAASAAAYLGGGDEEVCAQAAALTLKNILGLICDPAAGPVEVPCIKRNALGAAAALMGAEMALAGIRSFIPPDEVVDALKNTQQLLPQELKGSTTGGLGCTKTAARMRKEWQCKLEKWME